MELTKKRKGLSVEKESKVEGRIMRKRKGSESSGTREWADENVNFCRGCSHDCLYCYAKGMASRFGQVKSEHWKEEKIRWKEVRKKRKYIEGIVMCPSSHDITPHNLLAALIVLKKLLKAVNRVLIVSKPHLECIRKICRVLEDYKDQILFRFTIGATDDHILSFWEPNAPSYEERKQSLIYAFNAGFETSVSVEPMLDSDHIDDLVKDLSPYVTDSIWIGKMNHIRRTVQITDDKVEAEVLRIERGQTDERIKEMYERLKSNPIIKWKDSVKQVVGD